MSVSVCGYVSDKCTFLGQCEAIEIDVIRVNNKVVLLASVGGRAASLAVVGGSLLSCVVSGCASTATVSLPSLVP